MTNRIMSDNKNLVRVYATFILRGKELDPRMVTERLGIIPSRSFKRGDRHGDNKKWPSGFWGLTSDGRILSADLILHIEWLINQLEPVEQALLELVNEQKFNAEISCFWILPEDHGGLVLPSQLLERITDLGVNISLDIYCDR